MRRDDATNFAHSLLKQVNLIGWKVRLSPTMPALGLCSYRDKTLYLHMHHLDTHPEDEILDTIRHEIAHALCPDHGHDNVWHDKAAELGCKSFVTGPAISAAVVDAIRSGQVVEVSYDEEIVRRPRYTITTLHDKCIECGKVLKETYSVELNDKRISFYECGHFVTKVIPKETPFDKIVFDGNTECKHTWDKARCTLCDAKKLYPYQVEGARFLEKSQGRAAILDETGLGKTIQALAYLKFHPEVYPFLVICKSSLKIQFAKEIIRVMGMECMPQIISTGKDAILKGFKSYIVSYDLLRRMKLDRLYDVGIKCIIVDEVQQVKNPDSTRTQELRKLVQELEKKLLIKVGFVPLSATPWNNRGSEFFVALNFLDAAKFPSFERFKNNWVAYNKDRDGKIKEGGIRRIKEFREYTKDILIRRERAEVMPELPSIDRRIQYCEMEDPEASEEYSKQEKEFADWWNGLVIDGEQDNFENSGNALARLNKMRQIIGIAKIPYTLEFAIEFLESTEEKLVIFVHHIAVGQLLVRKLTDYCVENNLDAPLAFTASLNSEQRFELVEKFRTNSRSRIAVMSTLAYGEGINLQFCANSIMHERQWNPAREEQADEGRFIRIGQESEKVTATYITASNTIDDTLASIVDKKRIQFNAVMTKDPEHKKPTWNENTMVRELSQAIADKYNKRR